MLLDFLHLSIGYPEKCAYLRALAARERLTAENMTKGESYMLVGAICCRCLEDVDSLLLHCQVVTLLW